MSYNNSSNNPSKSNANWNSTVGSAKETFGNMTGASSWEQSGAEQRSRGDAEYKAAQAKGWTEGVGDRIGGKKDNVVGAVTGDKSQEMTGRAQHDKGKAEQHINSN
ncbi:hypothetical protein BT69DRAFT_1248954 [Atractiella rhizophila]|nr:hypothetical protein BT69DRAFT_1248954 [Atractiella rhizophila]